MLWEAASHGLANRPCQVSATKAMLGTVGRKGLSTRIYPYASISHWPRGGYTALFYRGISSTEGVPGTDGGLPAYYKLYSYGPAELDCFRGANSMPTVSGLYCWFITVGFSWVRIIWGSLSTHTSTHKWTCKLLPKAIDSTTCFNLTKAAHCYMFPLLSYQTPFLPFFQPHYM